MDVTDLRLETRLLGGLPLVNVFYDRLGIDRLLDAHVPGDTRLRLAPSAALGVVIRNLVVRHAPVYALGEWASRYEATQVGLTGDEAELLNDDRVGRMLSRLFDADRASLLTRLVLDAVETFDIDLSRLHNDSTSIKLAGAYDTADGQERGGKSTPAARHGFSKDHRPDLKQLVWMLTVTADGAVPIAFRVADGNTADVTTHIDTWNTLATLTGEVGFLYVADSKLATFDNVRHIHTRGGRFLSVLPASRREDRIFRDWVVTNTPEWTEAQRRPSREPDAPEDVLSTYEDHLPSADSHRIVWIHSTAKARRDATRRHQAIARAIAAIDALNSRLASPRCRIKTAVAAETEAREAIAEVNATRLGPPPRRAEHGGELPAGQTGPSRPQHRLQEDPDHHAADPVRGRRAAGRPRRRLRRDVAAAHQRPTDVPCRVARGLQVAAQPREASRSAQRHPAGRADVAP